MGDSMDDLAARQRAADGWLWWNLRVLGVTARREANGSRYWQTGGLVARIARRWPAAGRALRAICRRRGHHWSRTDWGWDGGPMLDVWCRWCDTPGVVPMREMPDTHAKALDLWDAIEQEGTR